MKRDVDTHDGNGGGTAFEGDGFRLGAYLSDVGADEGEERCVIQVLGREGVGSVAQGIEGLKCTISRSESVSRAMRSTNVARSMTLKAKSCQHEA